MSYMSELAYLKAERYRIRQRIRYNEQGMQRTFQRDNCRYLWYKCKVERYTQELRAVEAEIAQLLRL